MGTVIKDMSARETKLVLFQNATLRDKANINHMSNNPIRIKPNAYIQTFLCTWKISESKKQLRVKTRYGEDTLTVLTRNQTSTSGFYTYIHVHTHQTHICTYTTYIQNRKT